MHVSILYDHNCCSFIFIHKIIFLKIIFTGGASLDLNAVAPKPFRWVLDITWLNLVELNKLSVFSNLLNKVNIFDFCLKKLVYFIYYGSTRYDVD